MTDSALLLTQGDSSLLGLSALSAGSGVASGLAHGESGAQRPFSALLNARLQTQNGQAPPAVAGTEEILSPGSLLQNAGGISPLDGKALPLPLLGEAPLLLVAISEQGLFSGLPTAPVLADAVITDTPLDAEGEPVLLAEIANPATNGVLGSTLANTSNTEQTAANTSMQTKDPVRPLPAVMPQPLLGQGGAQDQNFVTPLTTLDAALAQKENIAQQAAQVSSLTTRPLSINERLALERTRSSVMATAPLSLVQGDKSLPQDVLAMAGLQTRNSLQAAAQAGMSALQNQFKPVVDKLVTSTVVAPSAGENTYSSVLSSVQSASGSVSSHSIATLNVATPVGQQGWANEMGQRVTWMANTKLHEAQLQLHPRHLGPLEVRITFGQEQQLNVNFVVNNLAAREAVDAAMPRLREMFEQQGMNLQDANVSQESFTEQRRDNNETAGDGESLNHDGDDLLSASPEDGLPPPPISGQGMIDAYA